MARVYSYERVSSFHQAQHGRGLERQATDAEAWCQANGLELDDSLQLSDRGASAFHGDHMQGALGQFLALAQQGELGENPILLVEAVDRLSRLELITAVQDVIFGLLRAGVTIHTLEDGNQYNSDSVNRDLGKVIQLIAKVHAAHEYSQRLSRRIQRSWDQAIAELEAGRLPRGEVFVPAWCRREDDRITLIPEKAEVVRRVFEMALTDGDLVVSDRLNAEKVPALTGRPTWTKGKVRDLLADVRTWGAVRLNRQDNMSTKRRDRRGARAAEERIFEDLLPAAVTREQAEQTLAMRASRTHERCARGRRGVCWNIGSRITRCSCGAAASLNSTKTSGKSGELLRYLKCSERCGAKGYHLRDVNGHVLVRLHQGQLQQLLNADTGRSSQIKQEQKAIERLQAQLALAEQQQQNAAKLFKSALLEGRDDPLYREAVEEARLETELAKTALTGAQQRLAGLRHEVDSTEMAEAVAELFDAFAAGTDTPEQRQGLNRLLRTAGIRVTLDRERRRVGMAIGDGPIDWQPLDPQAVKIALASRTTSAAFRDITITAESAAALAALDPDDPGWAEWLKSMEGVQQTAITSLPPGWDQGELGQAMKKFAKEITKNAPELAEALKAMKKD